MRLYLSCALTDVRPDFLESVQRVRRSIARNARFEILDFLGTKTGTPKDVYVRDIRECVATCDIMLAICDYSATGLGYEMATALEAHAIPVLAVAHRTRRVSRLIEGIQHPKFSFKRYKDMGQDVPALIDQYAEFILVSRHYVA